MALAELVARIKIISQSQTLQQLGIKLTQLDSKLRAIQAKAIQGIRIGPINTSGIDLLTNKIRNLVVSVGKAALKMAAFGGFQLFSGLAESIFATGAAFEQLRASLVTVTGSAENAVKAFEFIKDFSTETPFEVDKLTSAFILLKARGLDTSKRAFLAIGDAASSLKRPFEAFALGVANATAGNFRILRNLGFQFKVTGDQVAITFKGITRTVKKEGKAIEEGLYQIFEANFAGGMLRQSKTVNGILSNITDSFKNFADDVYNSNLKAGAATGLLQLLKSINIFRKNNATKIGQALGDGLNFFIGVAKQAIVQAKLFIISLGGFQGIKEKIDAVKNAFTFLFDKLGGAKGIVSGLNGVLLILGARLIGLKAIAIASWAVSVVTALYSMGAAAVIAQLGFLLLPIAIGLLIIALALVIGDIMNFANGSESQIGRAAAFWSDAFLGWQQIAIEVWESISSTVQRVLSSIGQNMTNTWNLIKEVVGNVWNSIMAVITSILVSIIAHIAAFVQLAIQYFNNWKQNVINTINLIKEEFTNAFNSIASFISGIIDTIVGFFTGLPDKLASIGANAASRFINSLVGGIKARAGEIGNAVGAGVAAGAAKPPPSGGKERPLSHLTASGQSIPLTLAKGIMQRMDIPIALMENMAANMVATMPVIRPVGSSNSFNAGGVTNQTHITVNGQTGSTPLQLAAAARAGSSDGITDAFASVARNFPLRTANA